MNRRSSKSAMMFGLMAYAASSGGNPLYDTEVSKPIEIQPRPPKGSKEYFFNERGEFSTEQMLKSETVFMCYAINDKNAIRKFKRWQHEN